MYPGWLRQRREGKSSYCNRRDALNPEVGLTTRCEAPSTAENSSGPPTSSSSMSGPRSRPMSTPLVRRRMPPRSMPSSAA